MASLPGGEPNHQPSLEKALREHWSGFTLKDEQRRACNAILSGCM